LLRSTSSGLLPNALPSGCDQSFMPKFLDESRIEFPKRHSLRKESVEVPTRLTAHPFVIRVGAIKVELNRCFEVIEEPALGDVARADDQPSFPCVLDGVQLWVKRSVAVVEEVDATEHL